jgi:methyltransferase (TIGR00027 family)
MRKGRASFTALAVASARALASGARGALIDPKDRVAKQLVPGPLASVLSAARYMPAARASLGFVDHIALRTAMIDRLVTAAVEDRGVKQLVIVGAGLDSRAHRLSVLRGAAVFEIDHPDVQRVKRERAKGLEVMAGKLGYVAADLEEFGMSQRLAEAGHDKTQPSFFLLEGLVPYLRFEVVERTLHQLSGAAAPGSQIAITYVTPDNPWLKHFRRALLLSMRTLGEPLQTPLSAEGVGWLLENEGFGVEHDSDTRDWARELCPAGTREPMLAYERMAVGVKK